MVVLANQAARKLRMLCTMAGLLALDAKGYNTSAALLLPLGRPLFFRRQDGLFFRFPVGSIVF